MREFFRPTKITYVVFGLLVFFALVVHLVALPEIFDVVGFFLFSVPVLLTFKLFYGLGVPVGDYSGDWFAFPSPNILGWILVIVVTLGVYYLVASLVSLISRHSAVRKIFLIILGVLLLGYALVRYNYS